MDIHAGLEDFHIVVKNHQKHHHHHHDHGEDVDIDDDFSDPEIDKYYVHCLTCESRLFGRQRPLHSVLGGGLCADVILWRKKELCASIVGAVTLTWLVFECVGFGLVTFSCNVLLLFLSSFFLWSNLASVTNIVSPPPELPVITIQEGSFVKAALWLRSEYHRALKILDDVVFGPDFKPFFTTAGALWFLSVIGNWFSLLTVFYLGTVILLTVPMLYESYEDNVDSFAEKVQIGMKRQCTLLVEKVLCKILKH